MCWSTSVSQELNYIPYTISYWINSTVFLTWILSYRCAWWCKSSSSPAIWKPTRSRLYELFSGNALGRKAFITLALMYGLLILTFLPVGNFTILRFHRTLCVLRVRRCLTGSLATGSTLRLFATKRKGRIISLVATSASVSFVKISQYTTVTIDFSEYFHYFYCAPLLGQITAENAPGQLVICSNIINWKFVIAQEDKTLMFEREIL